MTQPDDIFADMDLDRPSAARIYDYNLGGSHNFAVDRQLADQINAVMPEMPAVSRANRSFLRRAVRFLAESGIDQFLDLGSGIPTVGNVHEIAQQTRPGSRVVYIDVDPVAVAHANTMLANNPDAVSVRADLRDPDTIIDHPQVRQLIDFDRPLAVLLIAVLHFVTDRDDPIGIVTKLKAPCVPGSYLVISHATAEGDSATRATTAGQMATQNHIDFAFRGHTELTAMFAGYDLVEPGLVFTPEWRPDSPGDEFSDNPTRSATLAGVGVKR